MDGNEQRRLLIAAVVAVLISCVAFGTVNYVAFANFRNKKVPEHARVVCKDCPTTFNKAHHRTEFEHFAQNPSEEEASTCCYQIWEHINMSALMEKILQMKGEAKGQGRQESLKSLDALIFTLRPASAQKFLSLQLTPSLIDDDSKKWRGSLTLNPYYNQPDREHVRNVDAHPFGFRILIPGLYFVYGNIRVDRESNKTCRQFDEKGLHDNEWGWTIVLSRPNAWNDSGPILRYSGILNDCAKEPAAGFTDGVLRLSHGDHIAVQVSWFGNISVQSNASYFGLFMLGGQGTQRTAGQVHS